MQVADILSHARDSMTVKRVFGDPVERDGVTVIPVAVVRGGAGGGAGESSDGERGSGGGFGLIAAPAGVFVIRNGEVSWQPAVDVNRVILGGQIVAVVLFLVIRSILKIRQQRAGQTYRRAASGDVR
jgi:uncharacterized spore protein YtfJ